MLFPFAFQSGVDSIHLGEFVDRKEVVSLSAGLNSRVGWGGCRWNYPIIPTFLSPQCILFFLWDSELDASTILMLADGVEMEGGWRRAGWFGNYFVVNLPWLLSFESQLVYLSQESEDSVWLFTERLGWLWTSPGVFPSLYMGDREEWTYLNRDAPVPTLYDFAHEEWFELNKKYTLSTGTSPSDAGSVKRGWRVLSLGKNHPVHSSV